LITPITNILESIGRTPVSRLRVSVAGRSVTIGLKLESYNPAGSSKDRTAAALLDDLASQGRLQPSSVIVESTSGNLGAALALLSRELGYSFVAVIDPKTTAENRARILSYGAELDMVEAQDMQGGYLLSRLRRVRELCARSPRYVWTNQYSNVANPNAHYRSTAPELRAQMGAHLDAVFVPVSTGGTLVGIARHFREVSPSTRIIAVDAVGSVIFGGSSCPRKLTGIGSSRQSDFIRQEHYDEHIEVCDADAFAMCRHIAQRTGILIGGSSGATVFACTRYIARHREVAVAACICPDGGANYASSIYDDEWLRSNGFDPTRTVPGIDAITIAEGAGGAH